jgi:hypothetical protein
VGDPVRLVDGEAAGAAALGELVADAALPDARLGHDSYDLPVAVERSCQHRLQRRDLAVAPDEAREAARPGNFDWSMQSADSLEVVDLDRNTHSLQLERPEVTKAEETRDESRRLGGEISPARLGELLHALRQPHGMSLSRVVHAEIVTDLPDHDFARIESHANGEVEGGGSAELVRVAPQLITQVKGRVAGRLSRVLWPVRRPVSRVAAPITVNSIRYAGLRLDGGGNVRFLLRSQDSDLFVIYGRNAQ